MKSWILASALSLIVVGAAGAEGAPPAPPKSFDEAGIKAWIDANLAHDGWALLQADPVGVTFGGPTGVTSLKDGTLEAQVRREYFGPDRLGPNNTRSTLQTWNIDCKGPRLRITAMQIFQLNNLGGLSDARDNPDAEWAPPRPGTPYAQIIGRVCQGRLRP